MNETEITEGVIGAAIEVHRTLGPGLLESAYEECRCHELGLRGIGFVRQWELPVVYKGARVEGGYRVDLLVADSVIVELESVEAFLPIHEAQLLTYMQLSGRHLGLLINFNVALRYKGIERRAL